MGIVLLILKWIGLFLLAILALLLLVILIILFTPVRYEMQGKQTEQWQLAMRVRWLFAQIAIAWHSGMQQPKIVIKFFGKQRGAKKQKIRRAKKQPSDDLIYTREKPQTDTPKKQDTVHATQAVSQSTMQTEPPPEPVPQEHTQVPPVQNTEIETKVSPIEDTAPQKEKSELQKTFRRVCLAEMEEEAPSEPIKEDTTIDDMAEDFLTGKPSEETNEDTGFDWKKELLHFAQKRALLSAILRLCKRLLHGVRPDHFLFRGTFGTGDPVLTGYLLAACGILKGKFGNSLQITGDFSRVTAENIQVQIKGHITLAYFGFAMIAFVLAQPVRSLIKLYLKGRKENG